MAGILDAIAAHYEGADLVSVEVPEWGVTLYFGRVSAAEAANCRRGVRKDDDQALIVNTIIELARDKTGKRLFADLPPAEVRQTLMNKADLKVLQDIMARWSEATAGDASGTDDSEKND